MREIQISYEIATKLYPEAFKIWHPDMFDSRITFHIGWKGNQLMAESTRGCGKRFVWNKDKYNQLWKIIPF